MSDEKPPRLIDDPEFRDALRAVKSEEMPPERLARNLRSIVPTISQPPPPRGIPKGGLTIAGGAIVTAFLVGLVMGGVVGEEPATPTPEDTPIGLAPFSPSVTSSPVDLGSPASPTATAEARVTASTPEIGTETPSPEPTPTPAIGTLAEELRLYNTAANHVRAGAHKSALSSLDELAQRFPNSSLKPEADLTRAICLIQLKRLDDARDLLTFLVDDPVHAGRRAELERTFGDVERERGDCVSARVHYRAALDAGASGEEASAVRRGLGMCEAQ